MRSGHVLFLLLLIGGAVAQPAKAGEEPETVASFPVASVSPQVLTLTPEGPTRPMHFDGDARKDAGPKAPRPRPWLAKDKIDHFSVSAFLVGFGYYAARQEWGRSEPASRNAAIGFSLSVGLCKELYDGVSGRGTPSFGDVLADAVGIALAAVLINIPF